MSGSSIRFRLISGLERTAPSVRASTATWRRLPAAVKELRAARALRAGAARTAATSAGRTRRPMSAAARTAVSQRMKPYWVARRKAPLAKEPTRRPPWAVASTSRRAGVRHGSSLIVDANAVPPRSSGGRMSSPPWRCDSDRDAVVTGPPWAARFRRGSSRVFFGLAQRAHVAAIDGAMVQMRSTAWVHGGHCEVVPGTTKGRNPRSTPLSDRITRLATQQASSNAGLPPTPLGVRSAGHGLDAAPVPSASRPETSTRPGHIVRVVLNDNGGLNVAANPLKSGCPIDHLSGSYRGQWAYPRSGGRAREVPGGWRIKNEYIGSVPF